MCGAHARTAVLTKVAANSTTTIMLAFVTMPTMHKYVKGDTTLPGNPAPLTHRLLLLLLRACTSSALQVNLNLWYVSPELCRE